jgi:TPR repeat protein
MDVEKAVYYYKQAADQGYVDAMFNVAWIYEWGRGCIAADPELAIHFYTKAAACNHLSSIYNLANLYAKGNFNSVKPDVEKAMRLFLQCMHVADNLDGEHEYFHDDCNDDTKKNHMWMSGWCRYQLGKLYRQQGDLMNAQIMFEQTLIYGLQMGYVGLASIADNEHSKIDYLIKAAEEGIAEAWIQLQYHIDEAYLHQRWSVENMAILQHMNGGKGNTDYSHEERCNYDMLPFYDDCRFCHQECSNKLVLGPNRTEYTYPSSHLDSAIFEQKMNSAIPIGQGGQGNILLFKMRMMICHRHLKG